MELSKHAKSFLDSEQYFIYKRLIGRPENDHFMMFREAYGEWCKANNRKLDDDELWKYWRDHGH